MRLRRDTQVNIKGSRSEKGQVSNVLMGQTWWWSSKGVRSSTQEYADAALKLLKNTFYIADLC